MPRPLRYHEVGMHISPLPAPLPQLGGRPFSFYPPIRNLEHNEWRYLRSTWSEIVVVNTKTGDEVCVPRAFIGEVSITDHPVVIVGLKRDLEWNAGALCTRRRPVIELPIAVNRSGYVVPHPDHPAPVIGIRLESHRPHAGRRIGIGLMLGAIACWIGITVERQSQVHRRSDALLLSRSYLKLNSGDDYAGVIRKLGRPAAERNIDSLANEPLRILSYPRRQFNVVLAGAPPGGPHYVGAVDPMGRVLNASSFADGSNAAPLLRSLPRF